MADKDEILAKAKALLSSRGNNSNEKRLGSGSSGREERLLPGDEPQAVLNSAARVLLQPRRELDVYIAFDTTYSMQPYIDAVRRNIGTVTDELLGQGLRISINGVSDHSCGETYLQTNALTISPAEVKLSLDKMVIETTSNDDVPEAYECLALNLAERIPVESAGNKRAVILIGDSIPHGMKQDSYTDYGCPLKVDYAAAFRAMKKLCDGFYFVGCDKSNYELQKQLVSGEKERFVPLGSMTEILPQLLIGMAKKVESPARYINYLRQLEEHSPDVARKVAGLLR